MPEMFLKLNVIKFQQNKFEQNYVRGYVFACIFTECNDFKNFYFTW